MTLAEKVSALLPLAVIDWAMELTAAQINLTAGVPMPNGCPGNIPPMPRLNFSGMCMGDAGQGLRNTDFVSSWPSGMHVGAR